MTAVSPKFLVTYPNQCILGTITPEFFPRSHPWRGVPFSLLCVYTFFLGSLQKLSGYILPGYYLNCLRTTQCADAKGTFLKNIPFDDLAKLLQIYICFSTLSLGSVSLPLTNILFATYLHKM